MPEETTTEPTVGEKLSAVIDHERHLVRHEDCWRCKADERRYGARGDETEDDE